MNRRIDVATVPRYFVVNRGTSSRGVVQKESWFASFDRQMGNGRLPEITATGSWLWTRVIFIDRMVVVGRSSSRRRK